MELSDKYIIMNHDWDPSYLCQIFDEEFYDFSNMWSSSNVSDGELLGVMDKMESYCPIIEDISMEDSVLCDAVEKIEKE